MEEEKTNKKKLKKLKKRVKALAENQCYIEQKLDKLTEWLEDNIEHDAPEPEPKLKFDDLDLGFIKRELEAEPVRTMDELRQVKTYGYTPPINYTTTEEMKNQVDRNPDEQYTHKIEELETILRKRGVDFNYQKHLEHLVDYSDPSVKNVYP